MARSFPGVYATETDLSQSIRMRGQGLVLVFANFLRGRAFHGIVGDRGPQIFTSEREFKAEFGSPDYVLNTSHHYLCHEVLRAGGSLLIANMLKVGNLKAATVNLKAAGLELKLEDVTKTTTTDGIQLSLPTTSDAQFAVVSNNLPETLSVTFKLVDWDQDLKLDNIIEVTITSSSTGISEIIRGTLQRGKKAENGYGIDTSVVAAINARSKLARAFITTKPDVTAFPTAGSQGSVVLPVCTVSTEDSSKISDAITETLDSEEFSIDYIVPYVGPISNTSLMITKAEQRGDCMLILNAPADLTGLPRSPVVAYFEPVLKIGPKDEDRVQPNAVVVPLAIKSEYQNQPWSAWAGLNRGTPNGVLGLHQSHTDTKESRYAKSINQFIVAPGNRIALWGNRTSILKDSALREITVRRLLNKVQPAIKQALQYILFEPNDEFTRTSVVQMIDELMNNVRSNRGVYSYQIICDSSNNTPYTIDLNELHVTVALQPTRTIEVIELEMVITKTGVTFSVN